MKVTYNWLKDFVDIKLSPQALADKLTMAGLEVTSLEHKEGDAIFEIEITANRPDLLSVFGIAREVAVITGRKIKLDARRKVQGARLSSKHKAPSTKHQDFKIRIENKKDCPLYTAKIIRDVKVGPSPEWLKKRLELIGCRSTNNIVDITNYILFTWGEPLHAFDLDKLVLGFSGSRVLGLEIIIRRSKNGEEITSIDGIKRVLNEEILIIASNAGELTNPRTYEHMNKPIAIAGIMGGKDTEVTESTKNILLEAAAFNPIIIRRARQKLGIQTDSSYRFERGVDFETVETASWQAIKLIQELAGGKLVLAKAAGLTKSKQKVINLELETVNKILGLQLAPAKIKSRLSHLGFRVKTKTKNKFILEVPAYRQDVHLEIDVIEEIARIFGYERLPKSLPSVKPQACIGERRDLVSLTKNILVGLGLNEVITYSLIDKDLLSHFGWAQEQGGLEIINPLSKEQEILRPTILPSLAACVAYNLNQKQEYVNIFEIAKVFFREGDLAKEELVLGIALCGSKSLLLGQGRIKDTAHFLHVKGILETLFERVGIREFSFVPSGQAIAMDIYVLRQKIGFTMALPKGALDKFDIKNKDVFLLELSLEKLFSYALPQKRFIFLPKYPGIARDISFILKEEISIKDILDELQQKAKPLLRNIKIVDYYTGKQIPAGYKGLTISCLYRSDEKTLTEAEINPLHALLCRTLTERFAAKIR